MIEGKLKHSLKERCPECNKNLQLRVVDIESMIEGERITLPKEFIVCSNQNCDYERRVEQKRRRVKEEV